MNIYQPYLDKIGTKYNSITFLKVKREGKHTNYFIKCDCGNEFWTRVDSPLVKKGMCAKCSRQLDVRYVDITGQRFSKLVTIAPLGINKAGAKEWSCLCDCGHTTTTAYTRLKSGKTKSCGCLQKQKVGKMGEDLGKRKLAEMVVDGTNIKKIATNATHAKSGVRGVHWCEKTRHWHVQFGFKGKRYYFGRFRENELNLAIKESEKARVELYQDFLDNLNK